MVEQGPYELELGLDQRNGSFTLSANRVQSLFAHLEM